MKPNFLKIETHKVPSLFVQQRLQDYAATIFGSIPSKKGVKNAIKKGLIYINENQGFTGDWIRGGETISLYQDQASKKPSIDIPLDVLYEDEHLAVINKPAGVLVSGNKKFTIENALPVNLSKSEQRDALLRPEPIHRLDYPTTGALLIGKTATAVIALNKLFETRKIEKIYFAVTIGNMKPEGVISSAIDGKASVSKYITIERQASPKYKNLHLVQLQPESGRRHQLRKHLAEIGNPIFGDAQYGTPGLILKGKGLYLHARSLGFLHPVTGTQIEVVAPFPKKFKQLFPQSLAK